MDARYSGPARGTGQLTSLGRHADDGSSAFSEIAMLTAL